MQSWTVCACVRVCVCACVCARARCEFYVTNNACNSLNSKTHKLSISTFTAYLFCLSLSPLCLSVQDGESALQIAVRKGHLDVVKVLVQVCRDLHMENEVDQYYMDLADDHHHEHLVEYLSSEFPTLKRKVSHRSQYFMCIHTCNTGTCLGVWAHHLLPSCHITYVSTHFASVGIFIQ